MKNESKQLIVLLLVALMTFTFSLQSFAAGEELLSLKFSKEKEDGSVVFVSVDTNKAGVVADGKLVIEYDSDILRYVETKGAKAWKDSEDVIIVDNGKNPGTLVITFVGVEYADVGSMFNIKFKVLKSGNAFVKVDGDKSSITGADDYSLNAEIKMDLESSIILPEPIPKPVPDPKPEPIFPRPPIDIPTPVPKPTPIPQTPDQPLKPDENKVGKFIDVKDDDYFKSAVDFVFAKGYMSGISDYQFAPHVPTDRAMTVSILWRMSGKPQPKSASPFKDINGNEYYADAVAWAYENDIAKGMTVDTFGPTVKVTREQLVTFFYRYAEFRGFSLTESGDLSAFNDANTVSGYAVKSMTWAVSKGIIFGTNATTIDPTGLATRAQLAAIIMRFANMYIN